MEFLFLVCQQPGCRQLSPSQGGKTPVTPSCLARISWAHTCLPFITQLRSPESGFETTSLVVSSYSDGFTWEALSNRQNHTRKGPFGQLEYLFTRLAPRGGGPKVPSQSGSWESIKIPSQERMCLRAGSGTREAGRGAWSWN